MRVDCRRLLALFVLLTLPAVCRAADEPDQVTMFTEGKQPMNGALSPDGKVMAVNVDGGEVYLCNALTGDVKTVLGGHQTWVWLEFSPDSKLLASGGSQDGQVRLWDVASGNQLALLADFDTQVSMVRFSPDGKTVACSTFVLNDLDRDGTIKLWNVADHTEQATYTTSNGLTDVAFSPDGRYLASAEYAKTTVDLDPLSEVRIWELKSGKTVQRIPNRCGEMSRVLFSPDGRQLAVAGYDAEHVLQASHRIGLYDTVTWTLQHALYGHADRVFGLTYSDDGKTLLSSSSDGTLCTWDLTAYSRKLLIATGSNNTSQLTATADGKRFSIVAKSAEVVRAGALQPNPQVETEQWGAKSRLAVGTLAFSRDGKNLAVSRGNVVQYWDATTAADLPPLTFAGSAIRALSPDLRYAVAAYRTIDVWEVTTRQRVHSIASTSQGTYQPVYSPDGNLLAAAAPDHSLKIWDATSGKLWAAAAAQSLNHPYLTFAPDGKQLVSGEYPGEGRIVVWDLPAYDPEATTAAADESPAEEDEEADPVPAAVTAALKQAHQAVSNNFSSKLPEILLPVLKDLPQIEPHTGTDKPKWHRLTVNRDGSQFAAVRFKSPLKKEADLEWVFQAPGMTNWYILPVEGTMTGFKNFTQERDLHFAGADFDADAPITFQRLVGGEIKPETEYLLWFRFNAEKPVRMQLCVHLSEKGTHKDVNSAEEIAKSIGLKTPLEYRTLTNVPLKPAREMTHGAAIRQPTISRDGRFLLTVGAKNDVKLWDFAAGREIRTFDGNLAAISPDGTMLAYTDSPKKREVIFLVEAESGKLLHELKGGHIRNVLHLEFSPDGSRLASGGAGGMVGLWDVKTGKQNWSPFEFK